MKTRYILALLSAFVLALSGCGSSSSDNDNNKDLDTDEAFLQFCLDFPNADECDRINGFADDLGFGNYYGGGNDFFSDNAFGNSGIGCGCRRGTRGVLFRGVRRCESEAIFNSLSGNDVGVRYRRNSNGKSSVWVSFDSSSSSDLGNSNWSQSNSYSCNSRVGVRCDLNNGNRDCRGFRDRRGRRVRATCEPISGHRVRWGYCEPR